MAILFEVESKLGKRISVTKEYWDFIVSKHESVKFLKDETKRTLKNPLIVRLSKEDPNVYLYYSEYKDYYLCVVCKHLDGEGFLITAYLTDRVKKGVTVL